MVQEYLIISMKDKISFANDIDFLDETIEDICQSGFKLGKGIK